MKKPILITLLILLQGLYSEAQYTATTPVTGLSSPVAFTFTPDGRYLITLKSGILRMHNADGSFLNNFYDLTDSTYNNFERGLLGIEIDPDFVNNHYVYAYYNHRYPIASGPQSIRVVRFTEDNNVGTNPLLILNIPVGSIAGNHVGGNLRFRPSEPNFIYVSIGELAVTSNAQTLANPFGKMLRIGKDGSIPTNNPFYDDGNPSTGNDDRIWSYGHRNPFDFCFSTVNDSLYATENGSSTNLEGDDEVNLIIKGKNYGWPACEGYDLYNSSTDCNNAAYTDPIAIFSGTNSLPAVTGILFYSGTVMPEFNNHLLVADNGLGRISDLTLGNAPFYNTVSSNTVWMDGSSTDGLTTLKQGAEGCIYAMHGGYAPNGVIYRICPTTLSIAGKTGTAISLVASPNPFHENTRINYSFTGNAHVRISLHDLTGRKIATLVEEEKTGDEYSLELDAAALNLHKGIYFCSIQVNNQSVETLRLVHIK